MDFYIVDVFAERKYSGNQLAVFIDALNLSDGEMQAIAREMNFALKYRVKLIKSL